MPKAICISLLIIMLVFCGGAEAIAEDNGIEPWAARLVADSFPAEEAVADLTETISSIVNLEINGEPVTPDAPPYITEAGHTMVPLRFISDWAGAVTDWDEINRVAIVMKIDLEIHLPIGSSTATVNGQSVALDAPAEISNGRTMVPLRFVLENLGAEVDWDGATRTVRITFAENAVVPEYELTPADWGRITGYYYNSDSWTMLSSYPSTFDSLSVFRYKLTPEGGIETKGYNSLWLTNAEPFARREGIEILALFTDFGDPSPDVHSSAELLANPAYRANAVANIVDLVNEYNYDGVDIDFEWITLENRDQYVSFIRELKAALGDKIVAVSISPRRYASETWLDKYDYQGMGEAADRLHFMFYDQSAGSATPGPGAGLDWVKAGLDYLIQYVPREKIHVMLGAYGRSWGASGDAVAIYIDRAYELAAEEGVPILRDEASGVPYYSWTGDDGIARQVWFEDAQSLGEKAALARAYGVAGIGVWRMGIVPDDVWLSIVNNYRND